MSGKPPFSQMDLIPPAIGLNIPSYKDVIVVEPVRGVESLDELWLETPAYGLHRRIKPSGTFGG